MTFENNGTLQKWHMTNNPPKIHIYGTHKKKLSYKNGTPCEKLSKCYLIRAEHSEPWLWDFKIEFFLFVSSCRGRFYKQGICITSKPIM